MGGDSNRKIHTITLLKRRNCYITTKSAELGKSNDNANAIDYIKYVEY